MMKELAFVPPIVLDAVNVTAVVPVFWMVIVCAAVVVPTAVDAKLSEAGVNVSVGPDVAPVPESATVCGVPVALS